MLISTWYLRCGSFLIFLPPVSSSLRSNDCIGCQARSRWRDLLPSWHQDLWSSVGPRLLKGRKRTMLNLCNVSGFEFNIEAGMSTRIGCFLLFFPHCLVKRGLTCAITPGLMGKGWIAGAWVTRGSVFSILTEYPAGWFGFEGIPVESNHQMSFTIFIKSEVMLSWH